MRIGIGSYTFPWAIGIGAHQPTRPLSALGLLDKAAALDVSVVQLCDNFPLETLSSTELAQLRDHALGLGISLEIGTRGITPAHLRRFLTLAQYLSSPLVRVVVDTLTEHPEPGQVIDCLRAVLPSYADAGIALAVENHDRYTAACLADIMTQLQSPFVGICLDTVNSFGALEGPEVVVNTLAPWVLNLHVKDFNITRVSHQLGWHITGCPAGAGRLNLPWLIATLKSAGRSPNAILEQWTPPEAEVTDTIAKEERWAWESLRYLQTIIPPPECLVR